MPRRSHRSFVSYIDKSREYYAAQGYEHPYRWAVADHVGFTCPATPLESATVGVVTTSYFPRGTEPPGVTPTGAEHPYPRKQPYAAPVESALGATFNNDLFWAKDETHTDDINSYLPVARLQEAVAAGRIGGLSRRFYGIPTEYSQRQTRERDAPEIEQWMRDDGVDLALLVGL